MSRRGPQRYLNTGNKRIKKDPEERFLDKENKEMLPYRSIAIAMFGMAVDDLSKEAHREEALYFLTHPGEMFSLWCSHLNVDPEKANQTFINRYSTSVYSSYGLG